MQSNESETRSILREMDKLIKAGKFEKAAPKFKLIQEKYKMQAKTANTEKKLKKLKTMESKFYKKWATHLETQARTAYQKEEWDESIRLASESIDVLRKSDHVPSTRIMEKQRKAIIDDSKRQITSSKFMDEVSLSTVNPLYKKDEFDVEVYFLKAEKFIKSRQYDKARDHLEMILVIDPYNFKAMYMLKNLYSKLFDTAKLRTDAEYRGRMAQIKWDYNRKISPKLKRGREKLTEVNIVENGNNKIRDKLQNIIIDRIDLDDATISSVITYLNAESKKLDKTDGAGINIVLRLNNSTDDNVNRITMSMEEVPFEEILKYVCLATGLKYRIEKHAVIIGNDSIEKIITEFFTVETDIINSIASDIKIKQEEEFADTQGNILGSGFGETNTKELKEITMDNLMKYFTNRGVPFPEGSKVAWDVRSNILTATNTPDNLRILEKLLKEIDIKIPLVLIETKFVEIQEGNLKEFGFDWQLDWDTTYKNGAAFGLNQFDPLKVVSSEAEQSNFISGVTPYTTPSNQQVVKGNSHILRSYGTDYYSNPPTSQGALIKDLTFNLPSTAAGDGALSFWLYALDQSNLAEVLSAPKVITKSGTTALIRMVEEEYYPSSWNTPSTTMSENAVQVNGTTPEFTDPTDLGIRFEVTPTVNPNNYSILLELHPVRSDMAGWTDYQYNIVSYTSLNSDFTTYEQPVRMADIQKREVYTKVLVYDGSTTVLGGMVKDNTISVDDLVPIIGRIPIAGRLFRSEYTKAIKTNLLIFVTARLVKPDGSPFREPAEESLFDFGRY